MSATRPNVQLAESAARWQRRVRLYRFIPAFIGVVGLVTVGVGIVIAVEARSATPLLGAGVGLILLSLAFRGDSTRVDLSWGDASISVVRGVRSALEKTAEAETPDGVRDKIRDISSSLEAFETRLAAQRRASWPVTGDARPAYSLSPYSAWRQASVPLPPPPWSDPTTAHERRGDQMQLTIIYGDSTAIALFCTVSDENGQSATARVDPTLELGETRAFSAAYPREFVGALNLSQGRYEVSWAKVRFDDSRGEEIAVDEFSWS